MIEIGEYRVRPLVDGTFGLDGGAMFGVVPKPLWSRQTPVDDRNRIPLAARCLLAEGDDRRILVDTGLGGKFDDKRAEIFDVERPNGGLPGLLDDAGLGVDAITDVVLTHLHFDHCGGTTRRGDDGLHLTFPRATHHVQRRNWRWAHDPTRKDAGSYRQEDFALLAESGRLHLVEGDLELFPGLWLHVLEGHTEAMQMVRLTDDAGTTLLYVADLVPTRAHLRWPYIMAYDNRPLVTLEEKRTWLTRAVEEDWIVAFEHDPSCAAVRVGVDGDRIVVDREIEL